MAAAMDDDDMETLISEQRKEIMAAKTFESDMDVAFNLQLQEAITASLFLSPHQPSSSSSSYPSPPLKPIKEEQGEDSNHISDMLMREIERFEQERKDFEQSQFEMNRIKQTLSIRLHDQKFASEILRIPDSDWQKYGDNFHKPYGVGSSSSSKIEQECCKLYFKGIVIDLGANDLKKLGAVGVAICDPRDNVIFELSKPLVDEREREISEEIAEVEALVEGLNAAMALDLKRVVYFCDDPMLHQYVSGRREPSEGNMINLIKSVNRLQGNFVYCNAVLVARTDIKFASQLARSGISSQLTRSEGGSRKDVKVACSICFEDTNAKFMFTVDGCRHQYCILCMKQHVEVRVSNRGLPKCPYEGCKSAISVDSCQKLLAPKLLEIMSQLVKEATIPAPEKVYCPDPSCSTLMSRHEVKEYSRTSVVTQKELGASRCVKCQGLFCVDCKAPWHFSVACSVYQQRQSSSGQADKKFKSLATTKKWRQCRKCSNMIELAEGCYHITCRCGHEFCYICGAAWKNKKATCRCRLWDEPNIIRGQNMRQQRRA